MFDHRTESVIIERNQTYMKTTNYQVGHLKGTHLSSVRTRPLETKVTKLIFNIMQGPGEGLLENGATSHHEVLPWAHPSSAKRARSAYGYSLRQGFGRSMQDATAVPNDS